MIYRFRFNIRYLHGNMYTLVLQKWKFAIKTSCKGYYLASLIIFFSLKWSPQETYFDILTLRYWLMPLFPKYECKKSHVKIWHVTVSAFNINTKFHTILQQLKERQLKLDLANIQVRDHLYLYQVYNIQHNQKFG